MLAAHLRNSRCGELDGTQGSLGILIMSHDPYTLLLRPPPPPSTASGSQKYMAEVIKKQLWAWESQGSVARGLEENGRRRLVAVMVARAPREDGDIPWVEYMRCCPSDVMYVCLVSSTGERILMQMSS